jgi:hypothetical protein
VFGIISNYLGFAMFVVAFLIALGASTAIGFHGDGPAMIIAGPLLIVFDLAYRLNSRQGHWLVPDRGGSILYVPVWCMGAVWLILGILYTVRAAGA